MFDKTGTITEGRPRVVAVCGLWEGDDVNLRTLIAAVGSAEGHSEHPIGNAISAFAKQVLYPLIYFPVQFVQILVVILGIYVLLWLCVRSLSLVILLLTLRFRC